MRALALLAAIGTAMGAQGAMADMDKEILLSLEGDAPAHGRCVLSTATGEEEIRLDTAPPYERRLVGRGLACEIASEGRLVVEIRRDGSRSRTSTNSGKVTIRVR